MVALIATEQYIYMCFNKVGEKEFSEEDRANIIRGDSAGRRRLVAVRSLD